MQISKKEKAKLKRWLRAKDEKWGQVVNGRFLDNHTTGPEMFHTHPTKENDGGYGPPSVHDMMLFIDKRKITPIQYVISERGIYKVHIHCQVKRITLLRQRLRALKSKLEPGKVHHDTWLKLVNGASCCMTVTFESW